jgi:hypothetical protein
MCDSISTKSGFVGRSTVGRRSNCTVSVIRRQMMINVHLAARVERLAAALHTQEVGAWLWSRLRHAFPEAYAALLMPNHLHVDTPAEGRAQARQRLATVIGGLRRSHNPGAQNRWARVELPAVIPDGKHHGRVIRYIALNPCRAGLVDDPLGWPWSTHRDVAGAIVDPWVDARRLAAALGRSPRGFAEAQHAYVSGDPTVAVEGTPFPGRAAPTRVALVPLTALVEAAASATRATVDDIRRRGPTRSLFLQLAPRHGWRDTRQLAAMCNLSRWAVRRAFRHDNGDGLSAADLCLGDLRLRQGPCAIESPKRVGWWGDPLVVAG